MANWPGLEVEQTPDWVFRGQFESGDAVDTRAHPLPAEFPGNRDED